MNFGLVSDINYSKGLPVVFCLKRDLGKVVDYVIHYI